MANNLTLVKNVSKLNQSESCDVPDEVLIRQCGGKVSGFPFHLSEIETSLVYLELGQLGIGPIVYGIFEGGRLEEFIPSHTLTAEELKNPELRSQVAKKLARIHSLAIEDIPISKQKFDLLQYVQSNLALAKTAFLIGNAELQEAGVDGEYIANYDYKGFMEWYKEIEPKISARYVFGIGDMNRLNTLVRDKPDTFGEVVTLIDYEAGGLMPRGLDLGQIFVFWVVEITSGTGLSGLEYPSEDIRREYVQSYIDEVAKLNCVELDKDGLDSVDHILMEADLYSMLFSMFVVTFLLQPCEYAIESGLMVPFAVRISIVCILTLTNQITFYISG